MARAQDLQRREALLDAGQQVLTSRGVGKATIDEITQSAGVAKGTFYLYFNSKVELIDALRADFFKKISDSVQKHVGGCTNPNWVDEARSLAHSAVSAYFRIAPSYQAVLDCAAAESSDTSWEQGITLAIADFLREASSQCACETTDPESTALFLFHGINGLCHHALHDDSWDEERTMAAINPFIEVLFNVRNSNA